MVSVKTEVLAPMISLGVVFRRVQQKESIGDCPFCEADNHFYANNSTGLWSCKKCGTEGNVITFLQKWADKVAGETVKDFWPKLLKDRGLPLEALKPWGIGSSDGQNWLLPVKSVLGTVRDIRRWSFKSKHLMTTTGCRSQLFGLYEWRSKFQIPSRVWICEGEWDAMALRWFLKMAGIDEPVVGVPGAAIFKAEWVEYFSGWDVWLMYDNDDAGDKGSARTAEMLNGVAKSLTYVNWPDTCKAGFDVRDFVIGGIKAGPNFKKHVAHLIKLCKLQHRREDMRPKAAAPADNKQVKAPTKIPEFSEVLARFKKWCLVNKEFEMALRFSIAVALSEQLPGDPVWAYLIGPPGSGKTVIVNSLQHSPNVIFRSNLNPKELVSGWNAGTKDPSLGAQLDGKILVVKDWTEVVVSPYNTRQELMGTLRGAYDGSIVRGYGNNTPTRDYKLHFSLLAAVTPIINGLQMAELGERFIKFQMMKGTTPNQDDLIERALSNINKDSKMGEELSQIVGEYMYNKIQPEDPPKWVLKRVVHLAQLVSRLRATVDRTGRGEDLVSYQPQHEVGTRVAKSIMKCGMMLPATFGKRAIDWEAYQIVERVAIDTMNHFNFNVIHSLMLAGGRSDTLDLLKHVVMPKTTLQRRLEDMEMLRIVRRTGFSSQETAARRAAGRPAICWEVMPEVQELWKNCRLGQKPVFKENSNE